MRAAPFEAEGDVIVVTGGGNGIGPGAGDARPRRLERRVVVCDVDVGGHDGLCPMFQGLRLDASTSSDRAQVVRDARRG